MQVQSATSRRSSQLNSQEPEADEDKSNDQQVKLIKEQKFKILELKSKYKKLELVQSQSEGMLLEVSNIASLISYWLRDLIKQTNEQAGSINNFNGNFGIWQSQKDDAIAHYKKQHTW